MVAGLWTHGKLVHLDALINNAGVAHETGVTKQGIERIFGINYLAAKVALRELEPQALAVIRDPSGAVCALHQAG